MHLLCNIVAWEIVSLCNTEITFKINCQPN